MIKSIQKTAGILTLLIIAVCLQACYPQDRDLTYEDLDIALTQYDKDYYTPDGQNHYLEFQTFVVPDTVIHIIEDGVEDEITREYDKYILDQVRSNMEKVGFTEETDPEINTPDLTVTVSVTTSEHIVYDWYPYWAWFWVFVKKGSSTATDVENYYPWDPYYGTSYTYTSGSIIMEMVDVSKVDEAEQEVPVIWAGVVNGATGGPEEDITIRISTGIDRCFNQSPYLFKQ